MKEVFRHSDACRVSVLQTVLESAGIPTFIRNASTQQTLVAGVMTAMFPVPEFWPALCVMNDDDYPDAMELLRDAKAPGAQAQPEWTCPRCGESVPAHFTGCWNCERPAES